MRCRWRWIATRCSSRCHASRSLGAEGHWQDRPSAPSPEVSACTRHWIFWTTDARTFNVSEAGARQMQCEKQSLAGAVSQRACVFCGSRVVLYPIADALHLIHGPVGCAAYTWDIRGALPRDRNCIG